MLVPAKHLVAVKREAEHKYKPGDSMLKNPWVTVRHLYAPLQTALSAELVG